MTALNGVYIGAPTMKSRVLYALKTMIRSLLKGLQSYLNKINASGGTGNAQVILAHLGWVQDVEPIIVERKKRTQRSSQRQYM